MPQMGRELTVEQIDIVKAWMKEKWRGGSNCQICQANHWNVAKHLVLPLTYSEGSTSMGGASYPQAMLICTNCGQTLLFNAVIMGIVPGGEGEADG